MIKISFKTKLNMKNVIRLVLRLDVLGIAKTVLDHSKINFEILNLRKNEQICCLYI